jgi:Alkaline phosphatase PhoX
MRRRYAPLAAVVALVGSAALAAGATAQNSSGFQTSRPSMLTVVSPSKPTVPLITTGETMPGGYRFESIPDGIALRTRGQGRLDLFVNHETSRVPFPYAPATATEANSQNDFDNSQVSHLILNQQSAGILSAKYAIASDANYQRFCTNYMGTEAEGWDRPVLFANEEAQDWVFRTGNAWPGPSFITPGTTNAEQAGVAAAHDVRTGKTETIYGLGRLNHENTVAIPVEDGIAVLTTDDTFFTTQDIAGYPNAWSQLYLYLADDVDDLMNDGGDLYAFVSDDPDFKDYFDFDPTVAVTSQPTIGGHFVKVPKHIATGKHPVTGAELLSSSTGAGYTNMLPPPAANPPAVVSPPPDGPQWVLDQWGNANINEHGEDVFRFVRLEDIAYDKRPGMSNNVYIADTGRATGGAAPMVNRSTNGRVWKFVLDPENPTENVELSLLVEGDDNPISSFSSPSPPAAVNEIHQPDNIETTANGSLFVQEDPSSGNQFSPTSTDPNATTARIWRVDLDAANPDAARTVAARVDQSLDELAGYDVDSAARANLGNWETSGVIDASSVFGPGAYLTTIQAHSLWVEKANGPDLAAPFGTPDYTFKREGGQLVLFFLNPSW